jgi:integrase
MAMQQKIKGINRVTKRLADGRTVTYWYAWKGGPALRGEPGSPEFIASYNEAAARKNVPTLAAAADDRHPSQGNLLELLRSYQHSDAFLSLRERTQADYIRQIVKIERRFAAFPIPGLQDRRARGIFLAWRDDLARRSRRQADYAWTVLARVLSWALNRGLVPANPCEKGGRLYRGTRADKIWTADDEAAFLARAPAHLHLPLLLALWTGQRQGDLLRLPWSAYDGSTIRLRQSKTGARVVIPVGAPLKAALDAATKRSTLILVNSDGVPWSPNGFRQSWRKACAKAGVVGVTFHDLRGTAVTRLAVAGCTEAEIATVTGHSLRDVRTILDSHYLSRDPALAESAIRKLEAHQASPEPQPLLVNLTSGEYREISPPT